MATNVTPILADIKNCLDQANVNITQYQNACFTKYKHGRFLLRWQRDRNGFYSISHQSFQQILSDDFKSVGFESACFRIASDLVNVSEVSPERTINITLYYILAASIVTSLYEKLVDSDFIFTTSKGEEFSAANKKEEYLHIDSNLKKAYFTLWGKKYMSHPDKVKINIEFPTLGNFSKDTVMTIQQLLSLPIKVEANNFRLDTSFSQVNILNTIIECVKNL